MCEQIEDNLEEILTGVAMDLEKSDMSSSMGVVQNGVSSSKGKDNTLKDKLEDGVSTAPTDASEKDKSLVTEEPVMNGIEESEADRETEEKDNTSSMSDNGKSGPVTPAAETEENENNQDTKAKLPSHQDLLKALKNENMNGSVMDFEDELIKQGITGKDVKPKSQGKHSKKKRKKSLIAKVKKTPYPAHQPWLYRKQMLKKAAENEEQLANDTENEALLQSATVENGIDETEDKTENADDEMSNAPSTKDDEQASDVFQDSIPPSLESESLASFAPSIEDSDVSQSTTSYGDFDQVVESEPLQNKVGIKIKLGGLLRKSISREEDTKKKRGPGRPKGTRNKTTLMRIELGTSSPAKVGKRSVGRPRKHPHLSSLSQKQIAKVKSIRKNLSKSREVSSHDNTSSENGKTTEATTAVDVKVKVENSAVRERSLSPPTLERIDMRRPNSVTPDKLQGDAKAYGEPMQISPVKIEPMEGAPAAKVRKTRRSRASRSSRGSENSTESWPAKTEASNTNANEDTKNTVTIKAEIHASNVEHSPERSPTPSRKLGRARKSFQQSKASESTEENVTKEKERKARKSLNNNKRNSKEGPGSSQKSILSYFKGDAESTEGEKKEPPNVTITNTADAASPVRPPRARKSFNPRGVSASPVHISRLSPSPRENSPAGSCSSQSNLASRTIKVTDLETVLGIGNQSLDKMDAKTLDKLVLEKLRCKSEPLSDSCLPEEQDSSKRSSMVSTVIAGQNILKKKKKRKYRSGTYKLPGHRDCKSANPVNRVKRMYRKRSWSQDSAASGTSSLRSTRSSTSKQIPSETTSMSEMNTTDAADKPEEIQVDSIEATPMHDIDFDTVASSKPSELTIIGTRQQRSRYRRRQRSVSPSKVSPFKQPWSRAALSERDNMFQQFSPSKEWLSSVGRENDRLKMKGVLVNGDLTAQNMEDQEAYDNARRSFRKRKATSDENFVYLPEKDEQLATDMPIDAQHAQGSSHSKRLRLSGHRRRSEEDEEELFLVHGGESSLPRGPLPTPPSYKPQHVRQLDPSFESESAGCSDPWKAKKKRANLKFVITPNGVMYPVTPPSTPETRGGSPEEPSNGSGASESCDSASAAPSAAAGGATRREEGLLPVCCCTLPGISVPNQHKGTYCQALDSLDGKVLGCSRKVCGNQLFRPAVKIPFMALCEQHKKRLKAHQCCAGCGHFCITGRFVQCPGDGERGNSSGVHTFHKHCLLMRDNKYHCPHCASESTQREKRMSDPTYRMGAQPPSFVLRKEHTATGSNARISASRPNKPSSTLLLPPSSSTPTATATATSPSSASVSSRAPSPVSSVSGKEEKAAHIKIGDKEINFENLPLGTEKKALELTLSIVQAEELPKRLKGGSRSLYQACKANDLEKVIFLLSDGADPNQEYEDHGRQACLHVSAENGNFNISYFLLQAGANAHCMDEGLRTPLLEAATAGHLKVVNLLCKSGAVADFKADDGMTALHMAAQSGHCRVVQYLVEQAGVPLNRQDDGGWTAMVWAAEHRHLDCVRYLLAKGTDPNIRDNEDNTCLHWAAFAGSVDIAEMCLDAGCDLEAANEHGDRPLHIAARQGHYKCVALFLARGADSESRNNANNAAIACCLDQSSPSWMALRVNRQLKSIGALKHHIQPERLVHRDIAMGKETHPIPVVNGVDQDSYPGDFQYVQTSIETTPQNINTALSSLQHCQCRDNCTSVFCACGRSSVRCWYTKEGRLVEDFNYLDPPLLFECNKACRCWATCANRVVQLGITVRLQTFKTAGRGWGARTLLDIKKGTYVCEYVGELISDAEADSREDDSYLFDLDNKVEDTFCIDARQYGNIARFINHLCEPNVIPVKVFIDHQDLRFPRICFFASRDIKAYEELGFDYGDKFWIIKWKQFTCECGSMKCRYNKDTIHKTIADFNARNVEEEPSEEPPFM